MSDITENKGASERWVGINPFIAALGEHLNVKLNRNKTNYDTEMGCSRKEKDEDNVKNLVIRISTWLPSIWDPEHPIVELDDGNLASENMVNSVFNAEEKGEELLQEFISRFTTENSKLKYNDHIKRQKVYRFEMPQRKDTNRSITEDEKESFGSILAIFESQKLNLKYIMNWPVTTKPWAICNAPGKRKSNSKSLFRNSLLVLCSS